MRVDNARKECSVGEKYQERVGDGEFQKFELFWNSSVLNSTFFKESCLISQN
jgi:hypothetical protein